MRTIITPEPMSREEITARLALDGPDLVEVTGLSDGAFQSFLHHLRDGVEAEHLNAH